MIIKQPSKNTVSELWEFYGLSVGIPLLLGLVLAPIVAFLIVEESWLYVAPLLFVVPTAILIIRYPFATLMVWMAVMPWFPFDDTYKYVYFTIHRMVIPIGLGIVILSRLLKTKKYPPLQVKLADVTMIAFGVMAIISIFVSQNDWKIIFKLYDRMLIPLAAYWLVRIFDVKQQQIKQLIPLLALIAVGECVIGLLSWFAPELLPSIWHRRLLGYRVAGTFNGAGFFGSALIFFMVFIYHSAIHHKKQSVKVLLILIFTLGVVSLFFTFTRGVWAAAIIALLGLWYLYPKPTTILVAIVTPLMIMALLGPFSRELVYAGERLNSEQTAEDRVILAAAGKSMFLAKPVFGWGFDNYDRYDWRFMERVGNIAPTKFQVQKGTSHNTYLTILAEMGIVGFSLYIFPVVWWFGQTIKVLPRLPKKGFWSRKLLIAMWLPLIAHMLIAQAGDFRFATYALTLFWFNLGLVASMVQRYIESPAEPVPVQLTHNPLQQVRNPGNG